MRTRQHRLWWTALLALVACQQPPDISGELSDYADLVSDANSLICDCPQDVGFAGKVACDEALGTVGVNERECLADVLDGHEEAGKDYLDCANGAYERYVDCLETNVSCEEGVYDECTKDHDIALAGCPQLPIDIRSPFESCTS